MYKKYFFKKGKKIPRERGGFNFSMVVFYIRSFATQKTNTMFFTKFLTRI